MSPVSIHTPAFISYYSLVQGNMAAASTSVYEINNNMFIKVCRLHSLTKHIRSYITGAKCIMQEVNKYDCKQSTVVTSKKRRTRQKRYQKLANFP